MLSDPKKDSYLIFKGVRFDVEAVDVVNEKQEKKRMEYVKHPGAVVILPMLNDQTIIMIRNYRFAVDEILWELPAGTLEPGEEPIETAKRELIEETGYRAASMHKMTSFYTSPGICNEKMYAFLAKDLNFVGQNLDEDEEITVEKMTVKDVLDLVKKGEIRDGKTLVTLMHYFIPKFANDRYNLD